MHLSPGIRSKHEKLACVCVCVCVCVCTRGSNVVCATPQTVGSTSSCISTNACVCTLPAGNHRLQQRPCSVLVWCHCRVQSPAAIVTAVILLGAGWAVPYYVPLPAYNLRKGGSFSAVLEGIIALLDF